MSQDEKNKSKDRSYTNGEITVFWKPSKCIHVTTCYRELIDVFNPRKRPWINMDGAPTEEIIRVVDMCPTDALTYKRNDLMTSDETNQPQTNNEPEITPTDIETELRVMKDGPLVVKGNFKIIGADGHEVKPMKMVSICRCGQSLNMPFCDGMHRKVGFASD